MGVKYVLKTILQPTKSAGKSSRVRTLIIMLYTKEHQATSTLKCGYFVLTFDIDFYFAPILTPLCGSGKPPRVTGRTRVSRIHFTGR
jgi:hypothetical protein